MVQKLNEIMISMWNTIKHCNCQKKYYQAELSIYRTKVTLKGFRFTPTRLRKSESMMKMVETIDRLQ